jgi:hypothetical protein
MIRLKEWEKAHVVFYKKFVIAMEKFEMWGDVLKMYMI